MRARGTPPRPGCNLGLGQESDPRATPSWAIFGPTPPSRSWPWPSDLIRRSTVRSGATKPAGAPAPETLTSIFSSFLFCSGSGGGAAAGDVRRRAAKSGHPARTATLSFLSCPPRISCPNLRSCGHGGRGRWTAAPPSAPSPARALTRVGACRHRAA